MLNLGGQPAGRRRGNGVAILMLDGHKRGLGRWNFITGHSANDQNVAWPCKITC